ncbi:hypothetical protein HPO_18078 [Hyphomonas polymorpha PS728]|uniref:Uncharacterized protein n=2 Tax=Hyphomonas polymorpha TaxID=74319 RepID=A0A062VBW1_9PROT|nr:hypothetical protein HPO_18078 [Hyphomonas polymorpha PS728]
MTVGQQSYDQAIGHCTKIARLDEAIANQNVAKRFQDWRAGQSLDYVEPPSSTISGPREILKVKVEPDFAYTNKDGVFVVLVWPYANIELRQKIAGIGIHMMQAALAVGPFGSATFCILDLSKPSAKPKRYLHGSIPKNASALLAYMLDHHELAYIQSHPSAA